MSQTLLYADHHDDCPADYYTRVDGGSIPWSLSVPKDIWATSFFFRSHIFLPRHKDTIRGFLQSLPPMYEDSSPESLLHKAVHVVSLGALSNALKSAPLRSEARREYGKALQELGFTIQSPSFATSNETLMSILLFALYEQITGNYSSRTAWTRHINGAVTLVRIRGQNQMLDPTSRRLFCAVRTSMV